jgi:carboxypeptidase family protein
MRQVVLVIASVSALSCGDGDRGSPNSPTPTPAAPTQTWTLSGTVTETFPTASTRIAGATITAIAGLAADGPSTTSDASGGFRLAGLAAGNYTIRGRAANYAESSQPVSLTGNQALAVRLDPVFQMVTSTSSGVFTSDGSCPGYWDYGKSGLAPTSASEPCTIDYLFDVHHDGTLEANLAWVDGRFGLITELYHSDAGQPSGQPIASRSGGQVATYRVQAHAQYVLRVRGFSAGAATAPPAGTTEFTLRVTRPN